MSACTFLGHRDCPDEIKPKLREVLIDLIENEGVEMLLANFLLQSMLRACILDSKEDSFSKLYLL